ncbi:glycosyltransferase family 4 protein [Clostridium perfringens]
MKVVHLSYFKAEYGGNFIKQQIELEKTLRKIGVKSIFLFPEGAKNKNWYKQLINADSEVIFLPEYKSCFLSAWKLYKLLKYENIVCFHSNFGLYDNVSFIISIIMRAQNIIHFRAMNDVSNKNFLIKLRRYVKYKFISRKSYAIAISDAVAKELKNDKFNEENIFLIEDGIDFSRLNLNYKRRQNNKLKFLMFGYDIKIKGVDLVLKAFEKLIKEGYDVELSIVIATNQEKFFNYIESENIGKELMERLNVLEPTENIYKYYINSDVFISASREEGFSNALCEAAFMKLPLIISDIEGTSWAKTLPSVLVFKNNDVNDLINRIKYLIGNYNEYSINSNESFNIVCKNYSIENWNYKIEEFYLKNILKSKEF